MLHGPANTSHPGCSGSGEGCGAEEFNHVSIYVAVDYVLDSFRLDSQRLRKLELGAGPGDDLPSES